MAPNLEHTALTVAPHLLGAHLKSVVGGVSVTIRITEVEAYEGEKDPASHAFRGQTRRNRVMFGPSGGIYVYRHMGLHWCMNITCGEAGRASAVLLRAGEVIEGEEIAWQRRNAAGVCRRHLDLARGPARLTVALGITGKHNGIFLDSSVLSLISTARNQPVVRGPRVGVRPEVADPQEFPWRFWIEGDRFISR